MTYFPVPTNILPGSILGAHPTMYARDDSDKVNAIIRQADEFRTRYESAVASGDTDRANALEKWGARAEMSVVRALMVCTISGEERERCTNCDHTEQLALLKAATAQ